MMKRSHVLFSLAIALVIGGSAFVAAQMQGDARHQPGHMAMMGTTDETICPVSNRVLKTEEAQSSYTIHFSSESAREAFLNDPATFLVTRCPVDGAQVNKLSAPYSPYNGFAHFFCCSGCQEQFMKEPSRYAQGVLKTSEQQTLPMAGCASSSDAGQSGKSGSCSQTCPLKGMEEMCKGTAGKTAQSGCSHDAAGKNILVDPICGMTVSAQSDIRSEYKGNTYSFCSKHCKETFEKDPGRYIKK